MKNGKKIKRNNSAKGYLNAHRPKETNHGRVEKKGNIQIVNRFWPYYLKCVNNGMRFNVVIDKNRWRFDVEVRKHTCTRTNNRVETRGLSLTWHDYYGAKTHSIPSFFLHNQTDLMCKLKKTHTTATNRREKKLYFFRFWSEWANERMMCTRLWTIWCLFAQKPFQNFTRVFDVSI